MTLQPKTLAWFPTLVLVSSCIWAGCAPETTVYCPASALVDGEILEGPTSDPVRADLRVEGRAFHSEGIAIRSLTVSGIEALNEGFNFDRWQVEIPIEHLVQIAVSDASGDPLGEAVLDVVAEDACGITHEVSSFTVIVNTRYEVGVERLDLAVMPSGGQPYLPADGTTAATLVLTANPEAVDALALVSASSGQLQGLTPSSELRLGGDLEGDATATALFTASEPGEVLLTVEAGGVTADPVLITVAGPPLLLPREASIDAGRSLRVAVTTDGALDVCEAGAVQGVSVTSGGVDITVTGAAFDTTGDDIVEVDIEVDGDLASDTQVVVTCRDTFGQTTTGVYSAVAVIAP